MSDEAQNLEPPSKKQKVEDHPRQPDRILDAPDDFSKDMDVSGDQGFSVSEDKCSNFVTPEELERLREFQVLDEVKSNDEDSNDEDSESSDGKSEGLPEEEIEKMLEEDLPEDFKGAPKPKEKTYITRQKIVLEEKGVNHFEVLPLDWMVARHYSGMPIYMHRTTRVCTLSKPYFLGKGNVRRHDIPISAIPCLAYRKALEEERKQKEIDKQIEEQIKSGTWKQNVDKDKENTNKNCDNSVNSDLGDQAKSYVKESSEKSDDSVFKFPFSGNTARKKIGEESIDVNSKCPFNRGLLTNDREINKNSQEDDEAAPKSISNNDHTITSKNIPKIAQDKINFNEGFEKGNNNASPEDVISEVTTEIVDAVLDNDNLDTNNDKMFVKCHKSNEFKTRSDTATEVTTNTEVNNEVKDTAGNSEANNGDNDTNGNTEAIKVPLNRQPVVLPGGIVMPPPRVETVSSSWKTQHLTPEEVNDYCKSLFKFKTVNIMHFNRWADRRKYTKARKTLQYPTLPEGTKLITIPAQPASGPENGGKTAKRDWVMNMNGRSYLSVFHEYVRRALQKQPVYEFKQLENASTPYQATVYIGGMQYGVGRGSSKRAAKSAAARASIHILIPEMKHELDDKPEGDDQSEPDFSFFDYVGIEDPRITEFCAATCEPSPHAILRTCLLRNFGAGERHINTEMKKLEYQKIELTMRVGKHSATVVCKNKKTAKQRASQAVLQALHPHVRSWGSLLRLYGSRSVKSCKEKKLEEQQITLLQDAAKHNEPNYAVLEKLRNEMRKLRERDEAVVPIGTLLVKDDLPTHSGSNLNNVDL